MQGDAAEPWAAVSVPRASPRSARARRGPAARGGLRLCRRLPRLFGEGPAVAGGCQLLVAGASRQPVSPVPPPPQPRAPARRCPAAAAPQCAWLWLSAAHDSAPLPEPGEGGGWGEPWRGPLPAPRCREAAKRARDGLWLSPVPGAVGAHLAVPGAAARGPRFQLLRWWLKIPNPPRGCVR